MAGVSFDDNLIYMGWYAYEYPGKRQQADYADGKVLLYGHNRAALIAQKGYERFSVLNLTFQSIVDNYLENAACILRPKDRYEEQSQSRAPIPFPQAVSNGRRAADQ